jgi:hypothetical protein
MANNGLELLHRFLHDCESTIGSARGQTMAMAARHVSAD